MYWHQICIRTGFAFVLLASVVRAGNVQEDDSTSSRSLHNQDWFVFEGDQPAFSISGTIESRDGSQVPIGHLKANLHLDSPFSRESKNSVKVIQRGGIFRLNIPACDQLNAVSLYIEDRDKKLQFAKWIPAGQLRQTAIRGLPIKVEPANRRLQFNVRQNGKPIANANVRIELEGGIVMTAMTNASGSAVFHCLEKLQLQQVTAWKNKQCVGGYSFFRTPPRDATQDEHLIEVYKTKKQKLQLVDETGRPIQNLDFRLNVATPAPDYNYLGTHRVFPLKTDEKGEALVEWFPELPDAFFELTPVSKDWFARTGKPRVIDGQYIVELVSKKDQARKRIVGKVVTKLPIPLKGFQMVLRSFQGPQGRIDYVTTFTQADGSFVADVIPGATYGIHLNDARWLSRSTDHLLYEPNSGMLAKPEIEVIGGTLVRFRLTQNPGRTPIPNQMIRLTTKHEFSWVEKEKTRRGRLRNSKFYKTNREGYVEAYCLDGEVEVSTAAHDWQFRKTFRISQNQTAPIEIHRSSGVATEVAGRVLFSGKTGSAGVSLKLASIDGETIDQQEVTSDENGAFRFSTKSSRLAVFAYSESGSVFQIVKEPFSNLELKLRPTMDFKGRLLDENDKPLSGYRVSAIVKPRLKSLPATANSPTIKNAHWEARSDEEGFYRLKNLPAEVRIRLSAKPFDLNGKTLSLGEKFFQIGEDRPLDVYRSPPLVREPRDIKQLFQERLLDCRNYGLRTLLVLHDSSFESRSVSRLLDPDICPAISGFLPIVIERSKMEKQQPNLAGLMREQQLEFPARGQVLLRIVDHTGDQLSKKVFSITDSDSEKSAIQWISKLEPAAGDARAKFNNALKQAKKNDRVVWAQISQTRCAPCFRLSRWIHHNRMLLEKHFVFVRIDNVREQGGKELCEKIMANRSLGIPFVAIFDAEGKLLIDGEGPLGNIGFPASFDSQTYFRHMIQQTTDNMTRAELDSLIQSLGNF